jgi:hypothetical protein
MIFKYFFVPERFDTNKVEKKEQENATEGGGDLINLPCSALSICNIYFGFF